MKTVGLSSTLIEVFRNTFLELGDLPDAQVTAIKRENFAGWDSVNQLYLIQGLEEAFQIRIPDTMASSLDTFARAEEIVKTLAPPTGA